MSASEDLIDFNIIENQKENIQSLPGGRSARGLANLFSPSPLEKIFTPTPADAQNLNDTIRQEYEAELLNLSESDDPLDIYDRYIRWTLDAYPSAQATPSSQLLPLLERATKAFLSSAQYKDDPRYLKLWLSYISFFSDAPRETFAFLARHNIGEGLALFYEEFAAWLEAAERWNQAEEVYKLGIEREARPVQRLLRKFKEFEERAAQRPENAEEPSSPALPTVRPALAAKLDPFAAVTRDPQTSQQSSGLGGTSSKNGRQKLTIFSDTDADAPAIISVEGSKGWQNIGSLAERKKENIMEPKPWVGETLKAGGKKSSMKMTVFKDESLPIPHFPNPEIQQVTVNHKNGRRERIFVDLESIYPAPDEIGTELSFEELRASCRGWLGKVWKPESRPEYEVLRASSIDQTDDSKSSIEKISRDVSEKLMIPRDALILDENGQTKDASRESKPKKRKVKEVNETQIIKAKLSSPSGPKIKRKNSKEPTMTLHTKAATDEIYDLFSQPLKSGNEEEEEESSDDDDDMTEGDYTSGGESTGTGRLATSEADDDEEASDIKSVSGWSDFTARKHVPKLDADDDEETRESRATDVISTGMRALQASDQDEEEFEVEVIEAIVPFLEEEDQEVETSVSPALPPTTRTTFIPLPPEDYDPPTRPFRDPMQMSQNRMPFMTPITEKTESSFGGLTLKTDKQGFNCNSPSKSVSAQQSPVRMMDELGSSPFKEEVEEVAPPPKIAQPQLNRAPKTNKTTAIAAKVHASSVTIAKEIAQKSHVIKDAQCNPVDDFTRNLILEALQPPLKAYEGFFGHEDEKRNQSSEIRKFAKAASRTSKGGSDKTNSTITMPPVLNFSSAMREYSVKRELGAGAYAPVYLIESEIQDPRREDIGEASSVVMGKGTFDHFSRKSLEALKMEEPPSAWEFYMMRQAKRRLGVSRAAESIIDVYEIHLYKDECYLIEEYRDQGTLLNLVNIARADSSAAGGVMEEPLVMFFAIELFRTMEALHGKGILHGDLKADNCLLRLDALADTDVWSLRYRKDGTGGWNKKGLALIDFGRGIDMKAFRPDVQFIADWKTGPQDCAEMRELRPWTYQIDYHGLANIIHTMLYGQYIQTIADKGQGLGEGLRKWRIRECLKRYWQTEIWGKVFDLLLNPMAHVDSGEGQKMPVIKAMRNVREEMEEWMEMNSEKGVGLQGMLRRVEFAVQGRRK